MTTYRKLMILVALIAALTMLATMTGVSFAASGGTGQTERTPPVSSAGLSTTESCLWTAPSSIRSSPSSTAWSRSGGDRRNR